MNKKLRYFLCTSKLWFINTIASAVWDKAFYIVMEWNWETCLTWSILNRWNFYWFLFEFSSNSKVFKNFHSLEINLKIHPFVGFQLTSALQLSISYSFWVYLLDSIYAQNWHWIKNFTLCHTKEKVKLFLIRIMNQPQKMKCLWKLINKLH